jgi:hypothetical protein
MRLTGAFGLVFLLVMFLAGPAISQANSGFAPIEIRLVAREAGSEWVEGKPGFNVALTPAGAQKYEQISAENVGRSLAIIAGGKIHDAENP